MAMATNDPVASALERLAGAAGALAEGGSLRQALQTIAEACAAATGAELVLVRVLDPMDGCLAAAAVATGSAARAAEIEGSRFPAAELAVAEISDARDLPA